MKEEFTFFWSGVFSQWYFAEINIDGMSYDCCEQYMMYKKAMLFNDIDIANQIMATKSPKNQKALGRKVSGFNKAKWDAIAKQVVYDANYAKFTQHVQLLEELLNTGNTTIVEASPYDRIWGIGLSASDPRAQDRNQWRGTNWLGEVLTQVREDILAQATSANILVDNIP